MPPTLGQCKVSSPTSCKADLSKKEIPTQICSGILTSSPALWVIARVDLLCSGNFCRCPGVSKGAEAKDRALMLPGGCQLFFHSLSTYPVFLFQSCLTSGAWSWQEQRNRKFAIHEALDQQWMESGKRKEGYHLANLSGNANLSVTAQAFSSLMQASV